MCGIAGFIQIGTPNYDASKTIKDMTYALRHRGPDDEGFSCIPLSGVNRSSEQDGSAKTHFDQNYSVDTNVYFGHRRLKIIDLSQHGHQPMSNDAGDITIIFNGEVYNYIEIRDELKGLGKSFVSSSDTEVIIKAYEQWGCEAFSRFNGMWALAICDQRNGKFILSRDRFGKKPLYYFKTANALVFASEIKSLLHHPLVVKQPNFKKIYRYIAMNYRYVDIDNDSFFAGISHVPKSTYVVFKHDLSSETFKYWELTPSEDHADISDQAAVDNFLTIFTDAIRIRLRSDVPVGCMLSGGLDSTSITSVAYKVLGSRIVTFSGITGEEKGVYDESEYIDAVIKDTNADFHYIKPDPADLFMTVDEMLGLHDEPICTVTWFGLYLIAKKIGMEKVPVILNGHAGDEMLAGYWDHYHYHFHDLEATGNSAEAASELANWLENHKRDQSEIGRTKKYIEGLLAGTLKECDRFPDHSGLFSKNFISENMNRPELVGRGSDLLRSRLYKELMFETVPAVLRPEDRNTMAFSIEARTPFLDHRLAEFCFNLPGRMKIRGGLGKWLLRESMRGILSEKVRTRKDKAGFIAPADQWFRTINRDQLYDLLTSTSFQARDIYDQAAVMKIFEEHQSGEKDHQMVLWQIMNLELWFRRFFDN